MFPNTEIANIDVIVVEDNLDLVTLYKSALLMTGIMNIQSFSDGRRAQAYIESGITAPDAIILDMHLPYVSGEELFYLIRRVWGERPWIFIITADVELYEKFKHGQDGVPLPKVESVFKPIRVPYLQKRIQECVAAC